VSGRGASLHPAAKVISPIAARGRRGLGVHVARSRRFILSIFESRLAALPTCYWLVNK